MYARRHMLIRTEMATLQASACVNSKEATVLLLFAIILESNEADLIYVMVQEGAAQVVRQLIQEQPSLNKRFPILKEFVNRFWNTPHHHVTPQILSKSKRRNTASNEPNDLL